MSDSKRRVRFMKALVEGSLVSSSGRLADIQAEFEEVLLARRVLKKSRKRLLQVLHSTRALDSTLKEFTDVHGCLPSSPSLGRYLYELQSGNCTSLKRLRKPERVRYQKQIVDLRNKYMHEAGLMPADDSEVLTLLAEMQACLQRVLSLSRKPTSGAKRSSRV